MTDRSPKQSKWSTRFANRWAWAPVGLLGGLLGTQLVVLSQVLDDPGFSVEPGYYQKAVDWDESRRVRARCEQLGWAVSLQATTRSGAGGASAQPGAISEGQLGGTGLVAVEVAIVDREGHGVQARQLSVEAFANGHSAERITRSLHPLGPGRYQAVLPVRSLGLWVFRVRVRTEAHDCQYSFRRDIARVVSSTAPGLAGKEGVATWN